MSKDKTYDVKKLAPTRRENATPEHQKLKHQETPVHAVDPHSGLYQSNVQEPVRNFIAGNSSYVLSDPGKNSGIVFGYDRPSTLASGLGGIGAQGTNTIDIVAGRLSSTRSLKDGALVNNSFGGDAARIYISQRTDLDTNFGLELGQAGELGPRSGIGIKADTVRLIGREGVKIVSGRSFAFKGMGRNGETNAAGGKLSQPAPPIELIAGNSKYVSSLLPGGKDIMVLQGVGKGENIRDAMRELADAIEGLYSIVEKMFIFNTAFFSVAAQPFGLIPACTAAGLSYTAFIGFPLHFSRADINVWKTNYTQPYGDKYVTSRNVFST